MYPTKVWFAHTILPLADRNNRWALYERSIDGLGLHRHTAIYIIANPKITENVILGQCFHRRTTLKKINVEKGCGRIHTQHLNDEGRPVTDKVTQVLRAGDNPMDILPLTAYAFELWPGSHVSGLQIQSYQPDEPDDTYIYTLL